MDSENIAAKAARLMADEFLRQLRGAFSGVSGRPDGRFFGRIAEILDGIETRVGAAIFDAQLAGFLEGGSDAVGDFSAAPEPAAAPIIPPPVSPPAVSLLYPDGRPAIEFPVIDRAGEKLLSARILSPEDFYSLTADLRGNAFTISGDLADRTLADVQAILQENFQTTASRSEFMAAVDEQLGDIAISDAHLEQVFRNNVNASYSDGQEESLKNPVVAGAFPYRAYYAIRDERVRPEHLAMETAGLNGTNVYHYLDPVWTIFRPPWDWNCRCGFTPFTIRQAARAGVQAAIEWLETGIEPAGQVVRMPDFRPSASWQRIAI